MTLHIVSAERPVHDS